LRSAPPDIVVVLTAPPRRYNLSHLLASRCYPHKRIAEYRSA
jgi:broad-specificity NMP kinase